MRNQFLPQWKIPGLEIDIQHKLPGSEMQRRILSRKEGEERGGKKEISRLVSLLLWKPEKPTLVSCTLLAPQFPRLF